MAAKRKSYPLSAQAKLVFSFLLGLSVGIGLNEWFEPEWSAVVGDKARLNVCFSPGGHCRDLIVDAIEQAQSSIWVQSYSFTSKEIAKALIQAKQKGVEVKVLADAGQWRAHHTQLKTLARAGIEVIADPAQGLAHNKVMIIDGQSVITGSYNWSNAAEFRNAENVLFVQDADMAALFQRQWQQRYQQGRGLIAR